MKALLKAGKRWVDIDTAHLFNNQYNTADGKRIFDQDILAIRDDARHNIGYCRYCGATVKRGEEEKHFSEQEHKPCAGCFWYRERVKDSKSTKSTETTTGKNGERITVQIRTTVEQLENVCAYCEAGSNKTGCMNKEHRARGIEWFTPENTFFLKYPNGFDSMPILDKLEARGFVLDDRRLNCEYHKKLGSYRLVALLDYEDGKPTGVWAYKLYNTRRDFIFRFENGELFTNKYNFGWRQVKTLEGVPADVMAAVKNICNH